MQASINRCILLGTIGKHGVEVSYHGQGTAKAAFMLVVSELGSDGKEHQLWQPVEIWGKKAEQAGELDAGAVVLVEGKLRRVKKGEAWETVVSGFDAQVLRIAPGETAAAGGRNN
jgi:single-stranded DNA-binding protein